jgi:hypothetical protein
MQIASLTLRFQMAKWLLVQLAVMATIAQLTVFKQA